MHVCTMLVVPRGTSRVFHRGGGGVKEFVACCFPYKCYAGNVLARKVAAVPATWLLWHKELEEVSFGAWS